MFTLSDGQRVLSATDLTNHLACPHLTQEKLAVARGGRRARTSKSPHADLLQKRGNEHEQEQLMLLIEAAGGEYVDLTCPKRLADEGNWMPETRASLEQAAAQTEAAMRAGTRLIYQGHFFDGTWQGGTDFLRRVDGEPSALGDYAYEVLDTKLAGHVKPAVVHQLAIYNRLVGRIQGRELPVAYVILGDGRAEPVDLTKYSALHRRVVRRFEAVTRSPRQPTYPEPVAHCPICSLAGECEKQLRKDDHLSLVANARSNQRQLLIDAGLPTVAALAASPANLDPGDAVTERSRECRLFRCRAAGWCHTQAG